MTDQPNVFDAIIAGMTPEQFDALAERTGHHQVTPTRKAAEAISQLLEQDNEAADGRSTAEVAARLARYGRSW